MLPFLPKSRTERVISLGLGDQGTLQTDDMTVGCLTRTQYTKYRLLCLYSCVMFSVFSDDYGESSNSLTLSYSKWKNPVFVRPPMVNSICVFSLVLAVLKFSV